MKPSKSVNSLNATSQQQQQQQMVNGTQTLRRPPPEPKSNQQQQQQQQQQASSSASAPTSPICRCRVMYLGSSVPHITKDGLQGIQEPLRELYPDKTSLSQGNAGIDSWLSVWSNGILIENVDETGREVKRFFKIEALHYCAAVKYVPQAQHQLTSNGTATLPHNFHNANLTTALPKFLPLDSPHARIQQDSNSNPPIFASILRRTTGVKVLECHAFICKREAAANALVRCCFHAYADTMYAKQIGAEIGDSGTASLQPETRNQQQQQQQQQIARQQVVGGAPAIAARRSKSIAALNDVTDNELTSGGEYSDSRAHHQQQDFQNAALCRRSLNNGQQQLNYASSSSNNNNNNGDISDTSASQQRQHAGYESANNLKSQKYNSKSMHQLNQAHLDQSFNNFMLQDGGGGGLANGAQNLATSYQNIASDKFHDVPPNAGAESSPFFPHNPYASRVPSYPPQNIIDQQQQQQQQLMQAGINGGTLRSVKSMAANSIASTLLRSKKHAKAMSMAQLNLAQQKHQQQQQQQQQSQQQQQQITSFHQLPNQAPDGSLYGGSFMTLPPVPPMFLQNVPRHINGSQTMKLPSRHHVLSHHMGGPPMPINAFETMTPKEMKKLLKKSAKYGLDASKFAENGLPLLPLRPMPMPLSPQIAQQQQQQQAAAMFGLGPPQGGTFNSTAMFPIGGPPPPPLQEMTHPDMLTIPFAGGAPPPPLPMFLPPPEHLMDPNAPPQPIKSILVKPNPEFLKSKAGKKWLKQQKEFKKLLPSHLDGLPIVFGPPPMDMMEPANASGATPGAGALNHRNSSASSSTSSSMAAAHRPSFMQAPSHLPPPPPPHSGHGQLPILDSSGFYNPHPLYGPSGRASAASTLMRNSPQIMQQHLQHQQLSQQAFSGELSDHSAQQHHHHHQMQMMQQRNNQHQSMYSNPILVANQQQLLPPPPLPPMLPPHLQNVSSDDLYGGGQARALGGPNHHLGGPYERQFAPPPPPSNSGNSSARRRRNHMVEQSVISLEDEENDDDEGELADESPNHRDDLTAAGDELCDRDNTNQNGADVQSTNGYYDRLGDSESAHAHRHRRRRKSSSGEMQQQQQQQKIHHMGAEHMTGAGGYQDDYEQINTHQLASEDRNSNSSGIYRRRGHINERAFSYSIRQEASKSSADNSDAEYLNGDLSDSNYQSSSTTTNNNNNNNNIINNNNHHMKYRLSQQQQMHHNNNSNNNMAHYDNPQQQQGNIYQDRTRVQYYKQHPSSQQHQQQPVDELSARLENQLNMKSFANSCVKSHM